jgi:hypothetical protein
LPGQQLGQKLWLSIKPSCEEIAKPSKKGELRVKKKGRNMVRSTVDRRRVGLLDKQARKAQREEKRKDGQNGQQSRKQQISV